MTLYQRDNFTPASQRHDRVGRKGTFATPETIQALISMSETNTNKIDRNEEKEIGMYRYMLTKRLRDLAQQP